jgi:hypothetical protein
VGRADSIISAAIVLRLSAIRGRWPAARRIGPQGMVTREATSLVHVPVTRHVLTLLPNEIGGRPNCPLPAPREADEVLQPKAGPHYENEKSQDRGGTAAANHSAQLITAKM